MDWLHASLNMKVPDHVKWGGPVKRKVGSQADGAAWGSHAGVMERDFFSV